MNAVELNRAAKEEVDRVRTHSRASANREIDADTVRSIRYWSSQPREAVDRRITELDEEWDIERYLTLNATTLAMTGVILGLTGRRKALILPVIVLGFLAQHAIHGWCPPLTLFRKMGIRTRKEIDREKYALKALRGDFAGADATRS